MLTDIEMVLHLFKLIDKIIKIKSNLNIKEKFQFLHLYIKRINCKVKLINRKYNLNLFPETLTFNNFKLMTVESFQVEKKILFFFFSNY